MKTKLFFTAIIFLLPFLFSLQEKEIDYAKLGKGRIFEKDKSVKKNILLREVHLQTENAVGYILYEKDGSLHDLLIEKIERIEFPNAEKGAVKIVFKENKMVILKL